MNGNDIVKTIACNIFENALIADMLPAAKIYE
jgi:hypothetical protein